MIRLLCYGIISILPISSILTKAKCQNSDLYLYYYKGDSLFNAKSYDSAHFYFSICSKIDTTIQSRRYFYSMFKCDFKNNNLSVSCRSLLKAAEMGLYYVKGPEQFLDDTLVYSSVIQCDTCRLAVKKILANTSSKFINIDCNLKNQIISKKESDQKYRLHSFQNRIDFEKYQKKIDLDNIKWLDSIVALYGYPMISQIGPDAAHIVWLIIQHSDLKHQMKYYPIIDSLAWKGEAFLSDAAYLEDRIMLFTKNIQKTGTQYQVIDNKIVEVPLIYPERVNHYRIFLGMEKYEIYIEKAKNRYENK